MTDHGTDTIAALHVDDVRFPTSRDRDGSDAMNPFPDYSAAYLTLRTSGGEAGYALVFTVGRGNDLQAAAIKALEPLVVGTSVDSALADLAAVSRTLVGDSQLRWLGPEKGPIHMAAGAVVNALWDLAARRAGKPLWRLLADLEPEALVDLVDFRYLRDALTEDEALKILHDARSGREERLDRLLREGQPAYTTTPGWLGYDDEKLERLCREAVADGFRAHQVEGRGRPRRGPAPDGRGAGGGRPGRPHRHRRQSDLGGGRCDQLDRPARRVRPLLDRGADLARRRARARCHPESRCSGARGDRRARAPTRSSSSSCCRPARSTSCRSMRAASPA